MATQHAIEANVRTFLIVWFGQVVSLVGSGLTSFALGVWLFERTGSATLFAMVALAATAPALLLSPVIGVYVDRWDRRWVMLLCDLGAGLSTLVLAALLFGDRLALWHIYLLTAVSAALSTFQAAAYAATVPLLVPQKHLGRANGLVQMARAAAEILSPLLAGFLVVAIHLQGIILIDVVTFLFAVSTLLLVRFPALARASSSTAEPPSVWQEMRRGWRYLAGQRGLLTLLVFFAIVNFLWGMLGVLITPMVLSFSSADALGTVITVAGLGYLGGSLALSVWGGPKRRIHGVLGFEFLSGFCFMLIGLRPEIALIAAGACGAHITIALALGSNQTLWQSIVPADLQGRVFTLQGVLAQSLRPLAYLLAGPLADRVFEPLLVAGGPLVGSIGAFLGTGPGRGIGLLFILMGLVKVLAAAGAYASPRLRHIEAARPLPPTASALPAAE